MAKPLPDRNVHWLMKIDPDTAEEVDQRVAALGCSRNEWLNRVVAWALAQPIQTHARTVSWTEQV